MDNRPENRPCSAPEKGSPEKHNSGGSGGGGGGNSNLFSIPSPTSRISKIPRLVTSPSSSSPSSKGKPKKFFFQTIKNLKVFIDFEKLLGTRKPVSPPSLNPSTSNNQKTYKSNNNLGKVQSSEVPKIHQVSNNNNNNKSDEKSPSKLNSNGNDRGNYTNRPNSLPFRGCNTMPFKKSETLVMRKGSSMSLNRRTTTTTTPQKLQHVQR